MKKLKGFVVYSDVIIEGQPKEYIFYVGKLPNNFTGANATRIVKGRLIIDEEIKQ